MDEHPPANATGGPDARLYRTGRRQATEVVPAGRARLSEEFGLDPSPRLVELASAILASDPSIDLPSSTAARSEPPPEPPVAGEPTRKIVSVLAVDVSISRADGSSPDPEAIPATVPKIVENVRATLAALGATVLALDGMDVVAVFGHPQVHEDDAVRAVAAADELVARPPGVDGFDVRLGVGIQTGETVSAATAEISPDVAREARRSQPLRTRRAS